MRRRMHRFRADVERGHTRNQKTGCKREGFAFEVPVEPDECLDLLRALKLEQDTPFICEDRRKQ